MTAVSVMGSMATSTGVVPVLNVGGVGEGQGWEEHVTVGTVGSILYLEPDKMLAGTSADA